MTAACAEDEGLVESWDLQDCSVGETTRCGWLSRESVCDASAEDRPEACDAQDEVTSCVFDTLASGGGIEFSISETSEDGLPETASYAIGGSGKGLRYYNGRREDAAGPSNPERLRSVDVGECTTLDCVANALEDAEPDVICIVDA